MNELNLKSKEFEAKYRRKEELANKDTIKGEEYEELRDLTNFVTEFKGQHEKAEQEYETHLKNEARVSRMVAERVFANKTSLSTVLDELITENVGRKATLEYISKRTAQRTENTHRFPEDAARIAAENRFFTLSQERDLHEESRGQSLLMKEHSLLAEMDHISMRIGQENTLVDGMNYKIQLLDNDIVDHENASQNNTLKRRIRAEINSLQNYTESLEDADSNLKKEINKEYEILIRNRMQMKKLKLESEKQKEILISHHIPNAGYGGRQATNGTSGGLNQRLSTLGQTARPDSSYPSPPQKSVREIQQFHRTVWEMRSVLYQIHPELRDRHPTERQERVSKLQDDGISEKSHHEQPQLLDKRFKKSPTNLSVSHEMFSRQPTNQSEGIHLQAPNPDAESVDSVRTVRVSEIEHILKYFNGDTEALQDSVINELDRLGLHYGDQRYQLLSMHSLLEFKKDLLKDYQIKRDRAKAMDETPLLNRLDEHPIPDFRIQMTQALEKKDLDNKFTTWKTSYNVGIYNTLKLKIINLVRKFAGWTESILKVATGYSLSKRVYDLYQEIEEVAARNAEKFEFDVDKIAQMKLDFSHFSQESVESQLFYDWMLTNEWFFMIFSHKQELADLLRYCKGKLLPEDSLIKLVEKSWVYYNDFLDDNVRILSKSIKEFTFVLDRQREQVAAQGLLSSARSTSKLTNAPNLLGVLRSNGVIYHDFNFNDYVASLFAEEEHIDPDIIMVPIDPEPAPIEKKEAVEIEPQKQMTAAQLEMEKMKQLITKVSKDKDTEVRSLEFKSHFVDFMKSINQSYGILKTGLSTDRKVGNEDASTTHLGTEAGKLDQTSSGMTLFKKLRVKTAKNHIASKIDSGLSLLKKPRAITAGASKAASHLDIIVGSGRDGSRGHDKVLQTQPFDFRTKRGSSIDRLKRNRLLSKLNESSSLGNYGQESDSRVDNILMKIRVRSMTAERSRSNDRSNSREVLGRLTRKLDHTSINFRARLQRAELNSTADSFTDIRKPRAHLASSFFDQDTFLPSYSFRNSKLAY